MKIVVFQANSSRPPISATTVGSMAEPMKASMACRPVPPMMTNSARPPEAKRSRQLLGVGVVMFRSLSILW